MAKGIHWQDEKKYLEILSPFWFGIVFYSPNFRSAKAGNSILLMGHWLKYTGSCQFWKWLPTKTSNFAR